MSTEPNTPQQPQPIDLSAGLVSAPDIDLSAGMVSAAPAPPVAQITARRAPTTMIGKLGEWAEDIADDLKYGTDKTGVGTVLKSMGARGVYSGNSQAVGEFMASLPLGLLKATKGATQTAPQVIGGPEGRTWEGLKNVGGGLLQASTIPAAFVAPEASPLSKEGLLADAAEGASNAPAVVRDAAGSAVKSATAPFRESAAQPALQSGIRSTAAQVAQDAGVNSPANPSIYKTMEEAADAVYAKAKGLYQVLDDATGGRVQRFTDRLENIRDGLNELTGTEEDTAKEASLLKAQKETEDAMQEAFAEAKANGVDPKTVDQAKASFKQSQALYDLDTAIQRSTSGKPVGVGNAEGLPETVDPKKLAPRITALWKSGRLEQGIGPENTADLMDTVGQAAKQQKAAIRNRVILKIAVPTIAGAGALGEAIHLGGQAIDKLSTGGQ